MDSPHCSRTLLLNSIIVLINDTYKDYKFPSIDHSAPYTVSNLKYFSRLFLQAHLWKIHCSLEIKLQKGIMHNTFQDILKLHDRTKGEIGK